MTISFQVLGEQVEQTRRAQGLTQGQLAEKARVGLQTVVRIEQGNSGVGVGNLSAVLTALELSLRLIPEGAEEALPLHPLDARDDRVEQRVREAAQAACEVLDGLFDGEPPETRGIGSNFIGHLEAHLLAMLTGEPGCFPSHRVVLPKLVYADTEFGRQYQLREGADGFVPWVASQAVGLDDGVFKPAARIADLYTSWEAARRAVQDYVTRNGHPPGPVAIVSARFLEPRGIQVEERI